MKYKLLGGAMVVLILVCALAASVLEAEEGPARIHQHLSARGPDAGCGCDGAELCTHLPLVIIDTGGQEIPGAPMGYDADGETIYSTTADGESMLSARISILDNETRNHHPSDTPDLESAGLIRIRGRSSRYFDKHNYLLRFTDDDGAYADHEVMGMDAHYEWTLHGPYLDKSLIRNYLWYNIAGEMMEYSPNVRFCEVIFNGAYQGLYLMTETITNGENSRVNVSEPIDNSTSTGYVLRLDQGSRTDLKNINNFTYYTYRISRRNHLNINIEYPRSGALTQEMADAIEQDLSDFEKALYSFDYDDRIYGYQNWVDVKSFADYFILNEFTQNYDAGYLSTFLYKDIGGKYHMVVWDFNNACGNYTDLPAWEPGFQMQDTLWQWMLTKDEEYCQRIIDRYRMWRGSFLSEDYLMNYIDETIAYLGPAVERNFEIWGYSFEAYRPLEPENRNPDSFEDAVEQLKTFIRDRGAWMDEFIETVQQYGHPSINKRYNH